MFECDGVTAGFGKIKKKKKTTVTVINELLPTISPLTYGLKQAS